VLLLVLVVLLEPIVLVLAHQLARAVQLVSILLLVVHHVHLVLRASMLPVRVLPHAQYVQPELIHHQVLALVSAVLRGHTLALRHPSVSLVMLVLMPLPVVEVVAVVLQVLILMPGLGLAQVVTQDIILLTRVLLGAHPVLLAHTLPLRDHLLLVQAVLLVMYQLLSPALPVLLVLLDTTPILIEPLVSLAQRVLTLLQVVDPVPAVLLVIILLLPLLLAAPLVPPGIIHPSQDLLRVQYALLTHILLLQDHQPA